MSRNYVFLSSGVRDLGVAFKVHPGSQASSRAEVKNSALLSSCDTILLEPHESSTVLNVNSSGVCRAEILSAIGLETVGTTEFFGILYVSYEAVSILKNMVLCGLPVKNVEDALRKFLGNYTDELPAE